MSDGGLACLLPYTFMAGLNGIFSALRVYIFLGKVGTLLPCTNNVACFLPACLCLSAVSQLVAVIRCWKVYKLMQMQALSDIYGHPGNMDTQGLNPSNPLQTGADDQEGNAAASSERFARFTPFHTPFQGAGHQLAEASG
mmetsp:Transcript_14811/g.43220  ORF Transcript_14811/g.43220 Transcript_14811/m.43220 type:complete len:140 (-) Transcript_14811:45-464(-)